MDEAVKYKAHIDLLLGLGKVIISITARPDQQPKDSARSPMEQDMASVRTRYDDLWKGLEARSVILETTILQIERYRRLVRHMLVCMDRVERKLAQQNPVAGETDAIRSQISEHKVRCRTYQKTLRAICRPSVLLFSYWCVSAFKHPRLQRPPANLT